jgi:hypothetical protein
MSTTFTTPKYAAEGKRFSADIVGGTYTWKATLAWKAAPARDSGLNPSRTVGQESGPRVITAASESALRAALQNLDASVKFVKAQVSKSKLGTPTAGSSADADLLEQMRVDPAVSNSSYCNAARQFGQQPQPRPDFTLPAVVEKSSPYSEKETGELNHAFLQLFLKQHTELTEAGHGPYNTQVLLNWHKDSGLNVLTLASLEQARAECSELGFLRTALSGTRTRGGSPNMVHSYSFQKIQEYRRPAEEEQPAQPPAPGSPEEAADRRRVMKLATQHVQNLHPLWKPSSGEFQRELLKTVKEFAIASNPKLGVGKVAHF